MKKIDFNNNEELQLICEYYDLPHDTITRAKNVDTDDEFNFTLVTDKYLIYKTGGNYYNRSGGTLHLLKNDFDFKSDFNGSIRKTYDRICIFETKIDGHTFSNIRDVMGNDNSPFSFDSEAKIVLISPDNVAKLKTYHKQVVKEEKEEERLEEIADKKREADEKQKEILFNKMCNDTEVKLKTFVMKSNKFTTTINDELTISSSNKDLKSNIYKILVDYEKRLEDYDEDDEDNQYNPIPTILNIYAKIINVAIDEGLRVKSISNVGKKPTLSSRFKIQFGKSIFDISKIRVLKNKMNRYRNIRLPHQETYTTRNLTDFINKIGDEIELLNKLNVKETKMLEEPMLSIKITNADKLHLTAKLTMVDKKKLWKIQVNDNESNLFNVIDFNQISKFFFGKN